MVTSREMRNSNLFIRNKYKTVGKYGIPLLKRQTINLEQILLIAYSDIKKEMLLLDKLYGVHFFLDDYRFNNIYIKPYLYIKKLLRFGYVLAPDFSLYADMPISLQIYNVFKNRWVGAYWQEQGLTVIPTISWSLAHSFDFCFEGVEKNSLVAISTVGCLKAKLNFMRGYEKMLEKINPQAIICYGKIFPEMQGNIIKIPYYKNIKEVV